jgi:hypothetical protein
VPVVRDRAQGGDALAVNTPIYVPPDELQTVAIMAATIYTERLVMQDSKSALHLSVEDAIVIYRRVEFQLKEGK